MDFHARQQRHAESRAIQLFNAFNYHPPIIGFSSIDAKDSLRNVQETGNSWNLTTRDLAER